MGFLLEHLPPQAHLVIASRVDPPLPLARLRARGHLCELRAEELRFTSQEGAAFLTDVMGLALTEAELAALATRTEGWIAGLQLAALALEGRTDLADFLPSFTGSQRYIFDYLSEEVLQRQPEAIQSFLLETAILERLSAPLCNAVRQQSDSQALLERLEQAHLFLVPLDGQREWYRYHQLFAEMLRVRLRLVDRDTIPALHRRASLWCEQAGFTSEAVHHALAAEDWERAAEIMEQVAPTTLLAQGELSAFLRWL